MSLPSNPPDYDIPQPGDPQAIAADLLAIASATERLEEDVLAYLDAHTDDFAALQLLFDLREGRKRLATVEAVVEATAARRMESDKVAWPGFVAERKGGNDYKSWQHDRLAWAVTAPLATDPDTGVMDDHDRELIDKVRDRLMSAAAIGYWRTRQLRRLGVNPEDYCTVERGRRTVQVRRDADEAPAATAAGAVGTADGGGNPAAVPTGQRAAS